MEGDAGGGEDDAGSGHTGPGDGKLGVQVGLDKGLDILGEHSKEGVAPAWQCGCASADLSIWLPIVPKQLLRHMQLHGRNPHTCIQSLQDGLRVPTTTRCYDTKQLGTVLQNDAAMKSQPTSAMHLREACGTALHKVTNLGIGTCSCQAFRSRPVFAHLDGKGRGVEHLQGRRHPQQADQVLGDQCDQQLVWFCVQLLRQPGLDAEPRRVHGAEQPQALGAQQLCLGADLAVGLRSVNSVNTSSPKRARRRKQCYRWSGTERGGALVLGPDGLKSQGGPPTM